MKPLNRPCLILLFTVTALCLRAATFTVTTTNISGPGSLPAVIAQANATPGTNVIQFSVTNVITLGLQLPAITNSVTIIGRADVPTVISGGGTLPLFSFAAGTTNKLSRLVLANGSAAGNGAAINNAGDLHVESCILTNHRTGGGSGGAVYNGGTMVVAASQVSGNDAAVGGAFCNAGTLMLKHVTVASNRATYGFGGGIYNVGALSADSCTVFSNRVSGLTGQNGQNGQFATRNASDGRNYYGSAGGGGGGGAAGAGGGIFTTSGNVGLTNCTFAGNSASGGKGGDGGLGGRYSFSHLQTCQGGSGGGGGGVAGGIGGDGGQWRKVLVNDVVVAPTAGTTGAIWSGGGGGGGGTFHGFGSPEGRGGDGGQSGFGGGHGGMGGFGRGWSALTTVQGEDGYGGNGGDGFGAGVFVEGGSVAIVCCTLIANNAVAGSAGNGNNPQPSPSMSGMPGSALGGGAYQHSGSVALLGTILAGNIASNNGPDLSGNVLSAGYNLIGNNQGATNLSILDFQNVAANLGLLQDNGGSTLTCAPLQSSLAIGNGTSVGAPGTDQRGVPRPQGAAVDIGAVETVTGSPVINGVAMFTISGFSLSAILDATNSYRVQGSVNLTNWIDLTNYVGGGSQRFVDTAAMNMNRRFYRTATP